MAVPGVAMYQSKVLGVSYKTTSQAYLYHKCCASHIEPAIIAGSPYNMIDEQKSIELLKAQAKATGKEMIGDVAKEIASSYNPANPIKRIAGNVKG